MKQTLTKRIGFSATHYYWNPDFTEAQNRETFRDCANREGHGHNYRVEISVKGPVNSTTGMIINFFDLDPLLESAITAPLDHKNLNTQVAYFQDRIPTLENIALLIWDNLESAVSRTGLELDQIRVIENDDLYVEYNGAEL